MRKKLISPRIELGTFCVLSRCHNQLDHETNLTDPDVVIDILCFSSHCWFESAWDSLHMVFCFLRGFIAMQ